MCFFVSKDKKYAKPFIAKKDITCIKKVIRDGDNYRPLYQRNTIIYTLGVKAELLKGTKLEIRVSPLVFKETDGNLIDEGFHSYSLPLVKRARAFLESRLTPVETAILECTIPKGTEYYYNPVMGEYVSTAIVPIKETDF